MLEKLTASVFYMASVLLAFMAGFIFCVLTITEPLG